MGLREGIPVIATNELGESLPMFSSFNQCSKKFRTDSKTISRATKSKKPISFRKVKWYFKEA